LWPRAVRRIRYQRGWYAQPSVSVVRSVLAALGAGEDRDARRARVSPHRGTQSVITWNPEKGKYIIDDGFHRYCTMRTNKDIFDRCHGHLPIVVIDKPINDRMASTVRHYRARGKHSVQGMSSMVFSMLENGWADDEICNELGMSPEELLRLKHVTGFSKLFADVAYRKSWKTRRQIKIEQDFRERQGK
jgi:hypothetical protein